MRELSLGDWLWKVFGRVREVRAVLTEVGGGMIGVVEGRLSRRRRQRVAGAFEHVRRDPLQ
jgi:hypothetical protein